MPPPTGRAASFSVRRVAWTLCLLACLLVIAFQSWTYRRHRTWWATASEARLRYIRWTTAAQREAQAIVGDVEGLNRAQVQERLRATMGPDNPFPTPPIPPGAVLAAPGWMPNPPRELPVVWRVRERNWWIGVTIYDGRADGLYVDMLKDPDRERPPRTAVELWAYVLAACIMITTVTPGIAAILWVLRRDHRPVLHACLIAGVLGSVVLLAEDWNLRVGLDWCPLAFDASRRPDLPWEAGAIGVAIGLIAFFVPRRRPIAGFCASCGYNLTGNVSGVCSECGTPTVAGPVPA